MKRAYANLRAIDKRKPSGKVTPRCHQCEFKQRSPTRYPPLPSPPAKDGQLEVLPEAIDVLEADVPQPPALVFDECKNVVGTVRSADVRRADLIERDHLATLLAPPPEVLTHHVIVHPLAPRPATGDVFAVQERAAGIEQPEDFPIKGALPFVGEVMNRQAADDGVKRRLDSPEPVGGTEIGRGDRDPGAELAQPLAGFLHHDGREIDGDAHRLGERLQEAFQEDSIAGPKVQDASRGLLGRPDDA